MKNKILLIALAGLVASCGGGSKEDQGLEAKKAQLEELKKQDADLHSKIAAIEKELIGSDSTLSNGSSLVEVKAIQPEIFKTYIDVQGKIDADENVSISTEMPGTITKINVRPGDEVSRGQVLAETDARAAQQSLATLQINLDLANQMFEKQKNLWEQKVGTEVQYLQAKAGKEALEKQMASVQEQIRMSKIVSPIDGTVDAVDVKLGQAVAPGVPAIRVINFSHLKVKADLAESYASRVKKGDDVKILFPDITDTVYGKINFASRAINPLDRTFSVEVLLDGKKGYHPNMVTHLSINDYVSKEPIIVIPIKNVQREVNGELYTYIANGNKTEKRKIKTGREYAGTVEVTAGLKAGDLLITAGFENINEGEIINYEK